MNVKKEIGQKIKRIRQQKGITQEQLAELIGISTRTLGGIEIGENFMTAQTMEKVLKHLNVSLGELFSSDHLRPSDDLIKEIHSTLNSVKNDRIKIEEIYKVVKAIVSV